MQDPQIGRPSLDAKTIFRRVGRNIGLLFGSTGITLLVGIVQVGLNARALGPEGVGVLTMVMSYALLLERLFTFDTWQPLIKFGADAIAAKDQAELRNLVVLAALFDLTATTVSGIAGLALLFWFGPLFGIGEAHLMLAAMFTLTLFFRASGASTGVLRLFDRFALIAATSIFNALVSLAVMIGLFIIEAPLEVYVVCLAVLNVVSSLLLVACGLWVYRAHGLPSLFAADRARLRDLLPSFGKFLIATFPMSSINALRSQLDVFILGWLVSASAVGLYSIAQRVSAVGARMAAPVEQVVYPEISFLCTEKAYSRLRYILARFAAFGFAGAFVFIAAVLLFGPFVVSVVAGPDFAEAVTPMNWLVIALAITFAGFWVRPAAICTTGPGQYLKVFLIAGAATFATAPLAIHHFGVAGAGFSQIVFSVIWFGLNVLALIKYLRRHTTQSG